MADWWSTDEYAKATQSPYAEYVNQPTITWKDTFFGIPTSSYYQKLDEYASKVKELEWNDAQRKAARDETWDREDSQYQRLVADMKKAGLNPYWLLANGTGSPVSSSSQQASYGSSMSYSSDSKSKSASMLKTLGILVAFMKLLG